MLTNEIVAKMMLYGKKNPAFNELDRRLENNKLELGDVANKLMSSILVICLLLVGWDYKVNMLTL